MARRTHVVVLEPMVELRSAAPVGSADNGG
jgi:hypothetical protein